ncbi:TIGR03643 family protein [Salegentibacter echinorum]|uniref:TIGR03643 family protein n=1 Tax=Salegentibacter echinorum TaxID=1073325 RepID=A0A1M5GWU9_SALEC|nr:DUF2805 domain-containing protein [Salegentibacter echinorum]SHG08085.1 TIGR03643 family protein [Salegentibacter echinorum]
MKITEQFNLDERQQDRVIAMAWEDRTPFEAIEYQFGLTKKDVINYERTNAPA